MSLRIEFTPGVIPAVEALHVLAFGAKPSFSQLEAYDNMIRQSLDQFQDRYRNIPFFWANAIHSFEAISIACKGDRYPRHTLSLVFVRRSLSDYAVATHSEISIGQNYTDLRLMEEARYIYHNIPDL